MTDTSQRILDAARIVFARDGVSGATTREIARVAKVNEVTLFRYFKNKNELLRQMVCQTSKRYYDQVFADASLESAEDVRRTITSYALAYAKKLNENEDMVRTFMGELKRHPKLCRQLFVQSAKPTRQKFIDYLESARKAGLIRRDVDPEATADALTGMLTNGILRRPLTDSMYSNKHYVETCVKIFLQGIEK